ncbi:hypothetical protein [Paenibacillus sp.]
MYGNVSRSHTHQLGNRREWLKSFGEQNPAITILCALLPMNYSVTGYNTVFSSSQFGVAWDQIRLLCMFVAIGLVATFAYFWCSVLVRSKEVSGKPVLHVPTS